MADSSTGTSFSTSSNSDSGDNLIEVLKKSLQISSKNEFLESEIEDLKEFFTVQLIEYEESAELETEIEVEVETVGLLTIDNMFWLQVYLPITVRMNENEVLKTEKPLISFKIKLKQAKEEELEELGCNETREEEEVISRTHVTSNSQKEEEADVACTTQEDTTCNTTTVPYEILNFKVTELENDQIEVLNNILNGLISVRDTPILNVIEDFYIKLEDFNYPSKEVNIRDYYYPVFDCRHWGRYSLQQQQQQQQQTNKSTFQTLTGITNEPTTNTLTVSYRARALYDFQALMQGELSFKENEILLVLANLGNGWLTARRINVEESGLIPENYIERI